MFCLVVWCLFFVVACFVSFFVSASRVLFAEREREREREKTKQEPKNNKTRE